MGERKSNIELCRILSAILITLNHVPCAKNALTINHYIQRFFFLGGQTGVLLYVIIGAWFLCEKTFKGERIVRLIQQTLFYSLFLDIICFLLGTKFSFKIFIGSFNYWFCFGYAIMLLCAPLLEKMNMKLKKDVIIIGCIISVIVTMIGYINPRSMIVHIFLRGLFIGPIWFNFIFVIISYIKSSEKRLSKATNCSLLIFSAAYVLMYVVLILTKNSSIRELHSPICLICALSLFSFFQSLSLNYIRFINKVAACTFGVYLLQSHPIFRIYLWEKFFHFTTISEQSLIYILVSIVCTISIFIIVILIDTIRKWFESRKTLLSCRTLICKFIDDLYYRKKGE